MKSMMERTETEELIKILGDKSPIGVYIVQDEKFCYINPLFQRFTGYREDELLGWNSLELVILEDRKMVRENAIKMLKGELTSAYQFRVTCKNGSTRWIMETVSSIQYRGRRAILGNDMDITERKQMQEQHKLLAEHSMDIIYRLRLKDEHYIYVSPAVEW
ncbi:MAG: PAS domain S-box protein, partial [Dehalococcoidia bacterium]